MLHWRRHRHGGVPKLAAKVALVTDSTCDLPLETAQEREIMVVPLHILWGQEDLKDGVDLTSQAFYQRLISSDVIPTSSQPTPTEFAQAFQQARDEADADAVMAVTISSKLSGTFSAAQQGATMVDFPVRVVDSLSASGGLGVVALALADLRDDGASVEEMMREAPGIVARSRAILTVNTLEYLHRGGRITGVQRMMGTVLQLKPILQVQDGLIMPFARVRTRSRALETFAEMVDGLLRQSGKAAEYAVLLYTTDPAGVDLVEQRVLKHGQPKQLYRTVATPVVGVHTGPGAVGIGLLLRA